MQRPDLPLLQLRPIWAPVAWVSLLTNLLMLVPTLYMLQVFDRVLPGTNEWSLLFLSLITLYLYGVLAGTEWLRARMLLNAAFRFEQQASTALFQKKMGLHAADEGGWRAHWMSGLADVRQLLSGPALLTAIDLCMSPIFLLALYMLHPWLAAFAMTMMGLQFVLAQLSHIGSVQEHQHTQADWQQDHQQLHTALRHFQTALALGMQTALHRRWRQSHAQALRTARQQQSAQARASSLSKFVRYTQQGLGLGLGAWLVIRGELSAGAMIAANVLVTRSLSPIDQWTSSWSQILLASDSYRMLRGLIDERGPEAPRQPALTVPDHRQHSDQAPWIFQRVLLLIEGRNQPVIAPLTLTLEPGQITVLHGPSGAGKSSLLKAMLGQWPSRLMTGEIRWGQHPITPPHGLPSGLRIGYLPQDVGLFAASISENIARMAEPDPEAVVQAARQVGIHELILALPQGYDTRLGEVFALSSGLRQRIGLARALYGQPHWLLLDEPSAHLDQTGTAQLMALLRALQNDGVSVLMTTHHRPLIELADRRLRLDAGHLVSA